MDWTSVATKDEFLIKTTKELMVHAHSREGINIHVAAYFYTSDNWLLSTPEQLASCVMKGDSRDSERWVCWGCYEPPSHPGTPPPHPSFKTSELHCNHWWKEHVNHQHWVWARHGEKLGVAMAEIVIAVIGKDLKVDPIPLGQPLALWPKCFPSHSATNWQTPLRNKDCWGWPRFLNTLSEGHQDIMSMMVHPHANMMSFVKARRNWMRAKWMFASLSTPIFWRLRNIHSTFVCSNWW